MEKICRKCNISKSLLSFPKKSSNKDGLYSYCKDCKKSDDALYVSKNREKTNLYKKKWRESNKEYSYAYYQENKDRLDSYKKTWVKENKNLNSSYHKKWKENNKNYVDKNKKESDKKYYSKNTEKIKKRSTEWNKLHPEVTLHYCRLRQSAKMQRTPSWADLKKIKEIYKQSKELSKSTGLTYHVDHIIPLQGKNVSGLHVETNLQILLAKDNHAKSNKFCYDS